MNAEGQLGATDGMHGDEREAHRCEQDEPAGDPEEERGGRPGGRFLNIIYFYGGQASLRCGARILDTSDQLSTPYPGDTI